VHKSQLGGIVIDCNESVDLEEAGRFWSAVLGYPIRKRDDLNPKKFIDFEVPPNDPHITLQSVSHESRCHIDLETEDYEKETKRLIALGATVVSTHPNWTVFQAPTGHRFCIVPIGRKNFHEQATAWSSASCCAQETTCDD
jgi:hypothetical protein